MANVICLCADFSWLGNGQLATSSLFDRFRVSTLYMASADAMGIFRTSVKSTVIQKAALRGLSPFAFFLAEGYEADAWHGAD
jgi:hypothetical protein